MLLKLKTTLWKIPIRQLKRNKKHMSDKELVSNIYNTWFLKTTLKIKIQEWKMNRAIENGKTDEWQIIIWIY